MSIQDELSDKLQAALGAHLVDLIAVPTQGDRMVRLKTIEQILQDFEADSEVAGYFIRVKSDRKVAEKAFAEESADEDKSDIENAYLASGKLNIPYLMRNAELLYSTTDYPLARNIYKAILQSGERTAAALLGMARCFEAEGKLDEARAHYDESIAYQPSLEAYRRVASILIEQKKDLSAATVLERSLSLKELNPQTRFEIHKASGNCYLRAKKFDDAEKHYQKALGIDPAADEIRANLGSLYLQAGKISEAKRHFQDAIASNPRNDNALCGLASCFLEQGEKRLAHDHFAKSLEVELKNANAIFHLVKCAYEIRSYATAARIVENYIEVAPVNTNLLYSLAGLQYHLGRMGDARATAERILQLQADHAGAQELLNLTH